MCWHLSNWLHLSQAVVAPKGLTKYGTTPAPFILRSICYQQPLLITYVRPASDLPRPPLQVCTGD